MYKLAYIQIKLLAGQLPHLTSAYTSIQSRVLVSVQKFTHMGGTMNKMESEGDHKRNEGSGEIKDYEGVPNNFKVQVDSMFKEFNTLIDQVYEKIDSISKAVSELEDKLALQVDENRGK